LGNDVAGADFTDIVAKTWKRSSSSPGGRRPLCLQQTVFGGRARRAAPTMFGPNRREASMGLFAKTALLVAAVTLAAAALPARAETNTCTNRREVCFAYCEKNYDNAPRCIDTCRRLHSECMSNGCWDSKITAKRCGLTRQ
jgi:hypothetical protein